MLKTNPELAGKFATQVGITKQPKQLTPQQLAFSRLSPQEQTATFLKSGETIEMTPDGGFKITRGTGGGKPKRFTAVQQKAGGFADRVKRSSEILNDLEDTKDFDPASLLETISASIPLVGNAALSPEKQMYEQAKRDFVTAVLRLESGAVIADSEFAREDKKYFPQVGDSEEVKKQKRNSRDMQFDILKAGSGGAFDDIQEQRMENKKKYEEGDTATGLNGEKLIFKNGNWGAL